MIIWSIPYRPSGIATTAFTKNGIFKLNNGQVQQTQGPLRFELFIEMMSTQLNLLKNETARYELIETQNEKLNQDLEVTRLERESIRKTLTVSFYRSENFVGNF